MKRMSQDVFRVACLTFVTALAYPLPASCSASLALTVSRAVGGRHACIRDRVFHGRRPQPRPDQPGFRPPGRRVRQLLVRFSIDVFIRAPALPTTRERPSFVLFLRRWMPLLRSCGFGRLDPVRIPPTLTTCCGFTPQLKAVSPVRSKSSTALSLPLSRLVIAALPLSPSLSTFRTC